MVTTPAPVNDPSDSYDFHQRRVSGYSGDFVDVSGTSYTLSDEDNGKCLLFSSGSAITVTLPKTLRRGFNVIAIQGGAGQVTFSPASGATLKNASSYTKTSGQDAQVGLLVRANTDGGSAVYQLSGEGA